MQWSFLAVILLIVSAVAVGVVSAVVATWRLRVSLYELTDAVNVLQGVQTREVKVRAAQESVKRRATKDDAVLADLANGGAVPARKPNWWETLPGGVSR